MQYSSISNQNYSDMEKQPLQGGREEYPSYQQHCPCAHCNNNNLCYIESNARRRPSKLALLTFGILGLIFMGHMFGSHCRNCRVGIPIGEPAHEPSNDESIIMPGEPYSFQQQHDILTTSLLNEENNLVMDNNENQLHPCDDQNLRFSWDGKSTYYVPDDVSGLKVTQKYQHSNIQLVKGNAVVRENKELDQTKINFDVKFDNEILNDQFHIDESINGNGLELTLIHENHGIPGCIKVDAFIEVPSFDALDDLNIGLINEDITLQTGLELDQHLAISTSNGDITFEKSVDALSINLATANGDITTESTNSASELNVATSNGDITFTKPTAIFTNANIATSNGNIKGDFELHEAKFDAHSAHGNLDLQFTHINPVTTIKTGSSSGNINLKMPSNFESKFQLTTVVGKADIEATNSEKLHYKRSGHIVGQTIKGYYDGDENNASEIIASTVAGNVKLTYQ
ncbi:unnamed protein product [Cunninghamella blakesleeana]